MTEPLPAPFVREIDNDVDTLFFYPECGDFQEPEGLDKPYPALESCRTAPVVNDDTLAGFDLDRIHRQVIDNNLEITGIADLHQHVAFANDTFAAIHDLQDAPADRRRNRNAVAVRLRALCLQRRDELCPRHLQFVAAYL